MPASSLLRPEPAENARQATASSTGSGESTRVSLFKDRATSARREAVSRRIARIASIGASWRVRGNAPCSSPNRSPHGQRARRRDGARDHDRHRGVARTTSAVATACAWRPGVRVRARAAAGRTAGSRREARPPLPNRANELMPHVAPRARRVPRALRGIRRARDSSRAATIAYWLSRFRLQCDVHRRARCWRFRCRRRTPAWPTSRSARPARRSRARSTSGWRSPTSARRRAASPRASGGRSWSTASSGSSATSAG